MGGVQSGTPIWISITGWVVIILGWFIVSWQNNRREERKEVRGYLDEVVELIESLVELSIKYHMSIKASQKKEYAILYSLDRLEEKMKYLKFSPSANDEAYILLKSAITGKNFQSSSFKKLALNDPLIESIRDESHDLIRCLERQFLWAFRSQLPDRLKFHFRIFKETEGALRYPGWFLIGLSKFAMTLGAYVILAAIIYVAAIKYAGS